MGWNGDLLGFGAALAFGGWWVLAPRSVITFYRALHGPRLRQPTSIGIRIAGGLWLALTSAVALAHFGQHASTREPPCWEQFHHFVEDADSLAKAETARLIACGNAGQLGPVRMTSLFKYLHDADCTALWARRGLKSATDADRHWLSENAKAGDPSRCKR